MRVVLTLPLLLALSSAIGCAHPIRAGILALSDEHGRMGVLMTFAASAGFDAAESPRRDVIVAATLALRGGVLDARPTGFVEADAGVDVTTVWEHVNFRAGGFLGLGGATNGPTTGVGATPGIHVALSGLLWSRSRLLRPNPRDPIWGCYSAQKHYLGVEAGAAYAYGPGRAQFTLGPMYEWHQYEHGDCGSE